MTFQLLVVDDEATMRRGIANFIDWASIGCEVAGTASDGMEAISFLTEHPVDIIITDIKMPVADGLEVARYVYENGLGIKVLLLTGYADFAYAQTAIRYNVSSFILKPTNKKELIEAVQAAQKELITSKRNSSIKQEEFLFLRDQLLQELTVQPLTPELSRRLERLGLSLEHYCIAAFQRIPVEEDISELKKLILSERPQVCCYRYNHLMMAVFFSGEASETLPKEAADACREITEIGRSLSLGSIAAGISLCHSGPTQFGMSVAEAIRALTLNFYSEENISLFSPDRAEGSPELTAENSMDLFHFENCLNNWQPAQAQAVLDSIFTKFRSNLVNSRDAKNICSQIYYICSRVLLKRKALPPDAGHLNRIHSSPDIFSLQEAVLDLMKNTGDNLSGISAGQNKLIESAVSYIHSHLASPLSLELLAVELHISPSHLSRTFKKVCSESLTEYINRSRIEKAREYLMYPDILAYEVAELVGYNDPTYFSSIFKKYTGQSPTEYRQQMAVKNVPQR